MSAPRPSGSRACLYARYSTAAAQPEIVAAQRRDTIQFDIAQGIIVQRIYADYTGGLSPRAIAQALQDADRGARS